MEDAAGVATAAGCLLVDHLQAERFASVDPQDFYSFTEQRPQAVTMPRASVKSTGQPTNSTSVGNHSSSTTSSSRVGWNPPPKWRTFTNIILEVIKGCNVYRSITLAALWADVLYSAPVQFTGSATDPALAKQFGLGGGSRYEGPTGMVGLLHDTLRQQHFTSASMSADICPTMFPPHQIRKASWPWRAVAWKLSAYPPPFPTWGGSP